MTDKLLSRQEAEILDILKARGSMGMNSYAWRTRFIQLPARIFGLKQSGHSIATKRHRNGSVDYYLISSHLEQKNTPQSIVEPQRMRYEFDKDGNAWQVPVESTPVQEVLL